MEQKGIRSRIYQAIYRHVKPNKKYIQNYDYDENKESSYLKFWDVNNFYG